jgi:predicted nucleic acid-binding protein
MKKYFVDSNVFLRYLNRDEPNHAAQAAALFKGARDKQVELLCGPPVFFEIAWVLRSFYKLPNAGILDILESILAIPGLKVLDAERAAAAISLARAKNCSYADSYIAAAADANNAGVATFNTAHFSALGTELCPFTGIVDPGR